MISKTSQCNKVTKIGLKEFLMDPIKSVEEFVEEKKEIKVQESVMKLLLNDYDLIRDNKSPRKAYVQKNIESEKSPEKKLLKVKFEN